MKRDGRKAVTGVLFYQLSDRRLSNGALAASATELDVLLNVFVQNRNLATANKCLWGSVPSPSEKRQVSGGFSVISAERLRESSDSHTAEETEETGEIRKALGFPDM